MADTKYARSQVAGGRVPRDHVGVTKYSVGGVVMYVT